MCHPAAVAEEMDDAQVDVWERVDGGGVPRILGGIHRHRGTRHLEHCHIDRAHHLGICGHLALDPGRQPGRRHRRVAEPIHAVLKDSHHLGQAEPLSAIAKGDCRTAVSRIGGLPTSSQANRLKLEIPMDARAPGMTPNDSRPRIGVNPSEYQYRLGRVVVGRSR
jgi:hypothetical protein